MIAPRIPGHVTLCGKMVTIEEDIVIPPEGIQVTHK